MFVSHTSWNEMNGKEFLSRAPLGDTLEYGYNNIEMKNKSNIMHINLYQLL